MKNLHVTINANSYSAYGKVDVDLLSLRLQYFYPTLIVKTNMSKYPKYLNGLEGHYHILTNKEYTELIKL